MAVAGRDIPPVALVLEHLFGLLGLVLAHIDLHPEHYRSPSGVLVREQAQRTVTEFLPGSPAARRTRRRE